MFWICYQDMVLLLPPPALSASVRANLGTASQVIGRLLPGIRSLLSARREVPRSRSRRRSSSYRGAAPILSRQPEGSQNGFVTHQRARRQSFGDLPGRETLTIVPGAQAAALPEVVQPAPGGPHLGRKLGITSISRAAVRDLALEAREIADRKMRNGDFARRLRGEVDAGAANRVV